MSKKLIKAACLSIFRKNHTSLTCPVELPFDSVVELNKGITKRVSAFYQ